MSTIDTPDTPKGWLESVVQKHLAKNARGYNYIVCDGYAFHSPALGLKMDLKPAEGKVVDESDEFLLVKTSRTCFFVCVKTILELIPEIGSTVRITPYARRDFDGKRLDAPKEGITDGIKFLTYKLGGNISQLPIEKTALKSQYLRDMIEQVEVLPAGDGIRTLAQVLVDAGATDELVTYDDPEDEHVFDMPPTLQFRIKTEKHDGYLNIIYDRACDYYLIQLVDANRQDVVKSLDHVDFMELAERIIELVDDKKWRIAKVEILKEPGQKHQVAA